MAMISPGVQVPFTDSSFIVASGGATVPLFFVATQAGKKQSDGITVAAGTNEYSVVRTVTSLKESLELYGVPVFRTDVNGNQLHGDSRNEYGLFALNQYLGVGNRAYVVRANIDLTDADETFVSFGVPAVVQSTVSFNGLGNGTLSGITAGSNSVKPQTITVTFTSTTSYSVVGSVSGYIGAGVVGTGFVSPKLSLSVTAGSTAFVAGDEWTFDLAYVGVAGANTGNGTMINLVVGSAPVAEVYTVTMTSATAYSVVGSISGALAAGAVGSTYQTSKLSFQILAGSTAFVSGDTFTVTATSVTITAPLGVNDAAKRVAIVTALQAEINSNETVRGQSVEFDIISCPGYHECADEMGALSIAVREEAIVIADTPVKLNAGQAAQWAATSARVNGPDVAYYYPWGLASNVDGTDVVVAPSGIAIRTLVYSDTQAYPWIAPAGVSRGAVSGVSSVGYVSGTLGTATTYKELALNEGYRDALYEKNINPIVYFPGEGLFIWGQKTSLMAASSMNRINVSRLAMFLRRTLRKGGKPFLFEPNDQVTRDNLRGAADRVLNDVMTKRGISEYATRCDASNNTPQRIANNELWLDVGVIPMYAAEFIYIPLRFVAPGGSIK